MTNSSSSLSSWNGSLNQIEKEKSEYDACIEERD